MTVSVSTGLTILNRAPNSNKCPLKVSLVGIPQELPRVIENDENAVLNVLIKDYVGQNIDFDVKVAFQHLNSRFSHLKSTVRPQDSFVFVVGQLEIIDNDFYIYSKDINCIDVQFLSRRNPDNSSINSPETINVARSKLIATHRNVIESRKESSEVGRSSSTILDDIIGDNDTTSLKRVKIEPVNESPSASGNVGDSDNEIEGTEVMAKRGRPRKNVYSDRKGKSRVGRSLRSASKLHNPNVDGEKK